MSVPTRVRDAVERRSVIASECAASTKQEPVHFRGAMEPCPVVRVAIDLPIYRMGNGRTQVEQFEYVQDNSLPQDFFTVGEENLSAQQAQHRLLLRLSKEERGPIYQELQRVAQQRANLILTADGVVVNGNRRLAAMRDLYANDSEGYSTFSHVSAVVLPAGATAEDLELLEAELQMTPETKLDYGWVERRLKLRHHVEVLRISRNRIKDTYRFRREEEINIELAQLGLAEEYLADYLATPRAYKSLEKHEQMFKDLEKAVRGKSGEEGELRRHLGFMLAKERLKLGSRVYNYNAVFDRDFEKVASRFAAENGIRLGGAGGGGGASSDPTDPLAGLSIEGGRFAGLVPVLTDPGTSGNVVEQIVAIFDSIHEEKKDKDAKNAALKKARKVHEMLSAIELDAADPSTFPDIAAQLAAIREVAATLLEKVRAAMGEGPSNEADH